MRTAENEKEADGMIVRTSRPYASLQWKGTEACMDVYCKCGKQFHFDKDFLYHIKCGHCGTVYYCNPRIELIELKTEPTWAVNIGLENDL